MKALVVYDSLYGTTGKLAEAIARVSKCKAVIAAEFENIMLEGVTLLIVGSPTHGGRPKQSLMAVLDGIPSGSLKNTGVAAFDTRFRAEDQNIFLRLLMKTIGYAAPRIAERLMKKGGKLNAVPAGFIVKGKEGPLADGELERAEKWAKSLLTKSGL